MPATVKVQEVTGPIGSKVFTDNHPSTTKVRLFTADQATNQTTPQITFPVPIPQFGFHFSYWKHVCLDVSGSFTSVGNIRHYSDGAINWSFGTNGELRRGNRDSGDKGVGVDTSNGHTDNYEQAAGTQGITGHSIEDASNGHDFYNGQTIKTTNIQNDTEGSPATIESGALTAVGKSKAIVLQVRVASNASSGVQPAETATFIYDVID